MNGTKILLCMPTHSGIIHAFEAGLKHHGFEVTVFPFEDRDFKYPSLWARLSIKCQQALFGKKDAKEQLKRRLLAQKLQQLLTHAQFDHILFIRGDLFPTDTLSTLRNTLNRPFTNYQWDGLDRYPDIWNYLPYFDKFYVFDPKDLKYPQHAFLPTTNFYFDHLPGQENHSAQFDCYFTGTHQSEREHSLKHFSEYADQHGLKLDFHVAGLSADLARYQDYPSIQTSKTGFNYLDNLQKIRNAKAIVDFKTAAHNGLSFRAFEALGYRKKLITTNADIQKYDFYHPDNIFIWDGQHLDGLDAFLAKPLHAFPPELYEKYSFGNWIRYILDIQPHQKITLPE